MLLLVFGVFSCKPKKTNDSEADFLDRFNHKVAFHEVEWISLGEKNYLKTKPAPAQEILDYQERKPGKKAMCDIPRFSYIRSVVSGTESEKVEDHMAICKIFEVRDRGISSLSQEEIEDKKTGRMGKKALGCSDINEFFWKFNPLTGSFEEGEVDPNNEEVHVGKAGVGRFPWLYAYEENFGAVLRLRAMETTYIKRAPGQLENVKKICGERGVQDRNCYCEIPKGSEISVYLGEEPIRLNGHAKVQFLLDYTPPDAVVKVQKGKRCKDYKFLRKKVYNLDCGVALHGSDPDVEVEEKLFVDDADYDEDAVWSYEAETLTRDEEDSQEDSESEGEDKGLPHIFGFIYPKHFRWVHKNLDESEKLDIKTKKDVTEHSDDTWYWPLAASKKDPNNTYKIITSHYGRRLMKFWKMHYGLDIGGINNQTPIVASNAGKVVQVIENHAVGGNYMHVSHMTKAQKEKNTEKIVTRYLHAHTLHWKKQGGKLVHWKIPDGSMIPACTELGKLGTTGSSTGPHLHFEYEKNGGSINPCPILTGHKKCKGPINYCDTVKHQKQ